MLDPLKMFNVYGYGLCSVHASHVAAMARAAGLKARNQSINRHCVSEVWFDGAWHLLDASLVNYFPKPDGTIASVDEIIASITEFYKGHPELKNNPAALDAFPQGGQVEGRSGAAGQLSVLQQGGAAGGELALALRMDGDHGGI